MTTLRRYFLMMAFAAQALSLHAQTAEKPKQGFTLTLAESKGTYVGTPTKTTQVLLATYTNITKDQDPIATCASLGDFYLEILYNGVSATKDYRQLTGDRGAPPCAEVPVVRSIPAGGSIDAWLLYDTTKPGTYSFTVVQDSFPDDPARNVTVRSNTVTIVVPAASTRGASRQ